MKEPVVFRSHGGRPSAVENGVTPIDVAFVAAPTADPMGNATEKSAKAPAARSAMLKPTRAAPSVRSSSPTTSSRIRSRTP